MSFSAAQEIKKSRDQYIDVLITLGFIDRKAVSKIKDHVPVRILKSAFVAGFYPNIAKIKMPPQKYTETVNGVVPVNCEPSQIKFYDATERVFIHPTSINFGAVNFRDPFFVFYQKVLTSKMYVRDTTPVSVWPVLLFGGQIDVDHQMNVVSIDKHLKMEAFPRIGGNCFLFMYSTCARYSYAFR